MILQPVVLCQDTGLSLRWLFLSSALSEVLSSVLNDVCMHDFVFKTLSLPINDNH